MRLKVKKIKGGADEKPTKLEVIQDNPVIAKALVDFAAEKGMAGSGMRMKGSGWWGDFVDFLKRNKVISSGTKIAAYIATALGNPAIGTALTAASGAAGAIGFGYVNKLSQVGTGMVFNRSGLIQNQKTTRMKGGAMKNTAAVPTSTTYNSVYSQASGKTRM
jgi:trans-2-enoyl-CoA reductase